VEIREDLGTFECPVCSLASPHAHPANSIRWHQQHAKQFIKFVDVMFPAYFSRHYYPWGDFQPEIKFGNPEIQKAWVWYSQGIRDSQTSGKVKQ
jgi:hypothetical protein